MFWKLILLVVDIFIFPDGRLQFFVGSQSKMAKQQHGF